MLGLHWNKLYTWRYWQFENGISREKMTILNNGNVGIGTTAPAYALDMAAGDVYGYNGTVMAQASTTLFNYFLGGAGTIGAAATGTKNTGVGYLALSHLTTGNYNTANGYAALYNNTTNIATLGAITGGSGYTPGTYTGVQMTLSSGSSATSTFRSRSIWTR